MESLCKLNLRVPIAMELLLLLHTTRTDVSSWENIYEYVATKIPKDDGQCSNIHFEPMHGYHQKPVDSTEEKWKESLDLEAG